MPAASLAVAQVGSARVFVVAVGGSLGETCAAFGAAGVAVGVGAD